MACAAATRELGRKTRKAVDGNPALSVFLAAYDLFDHPYSLIDREHRLLIGVVEHRDHYLVEEGRAAFNNVQVAVGERVERTGKDSFSHFGVGLEVL